MTLIKKNDNLIYKKAPIDFNCKLIGYEKAINNKYYFKLEIVNNYIIQRNFEELFNFSEQLFNLVTYNEKHDTCIIPFENNQPLISNINCTDWPRLIKYNLFKRLIIHHKSTLSYEIETYLFKFNKLPKEIKKLNLISNFFGIWKNDITIDSIIINNNNSSFSSFSPSSNNQKIKEKEKKQKKRWSSNNIINLTKSSISLKSSKRNSSNLFILDSNNNNNNKTLLSFFSTLTTKKKNNYNNIKFEEEKEENDNSSDNNNNSSSITLFNEENKIAPWNRIPIQQEIVEDDLIIENLESILPIKITSTIIAPWNIKNFNILDQKLVKELKRILPKINKPLGSRSKRLLNLHQINSIHQFEKIKVKLSFDFHIFSFSISNQFNFQDLNLVLSNKLIKSNLILNNNLLDNYGLIFKLANDKLYKLDSDSSLLELFEINPSIIYLALVNFSSK